MSADPSHFADALMDAIERKNSVLCVGLDPRIELIPRPVRELAFRQYSNPAEAAAHAFLAFGKEVIDAVADVAPAVKIQIAFYEMLGWQGIKAYQETVAYARERGLLVIGDVKRGDIGPTCEAYAAGHLGRVSLGGEEIDIWHEDSITVNPYLGSDGIIPFRDRAKKFGKGFFVLLKTSNPSGGEIQDLLSAGEPVHLHLAKLVRAWGEDLVGRSGYSSVGAVVGATYPETVVRLRKLMPETPFLVPGFGAQGATAQDLAGAFDAHGLGTIVNSSRALIFAYEDPSDPNWARHVARAALSMTRELNQVRR
ncbi:MAG: orotidine-5'-phosphate decarboxylase [Planctomycetota bacterium]